MTYRKIYEFKPSEHVSRRAFFSLVAREKMALLGLKNAQASNIGDFHGHDVVICIRSDGEKESVITDDVSRFAETDGFRLPKNGLVRNVFDADSDVFRRFCYI